MTERGAVVAEFNAVAGVPVHRFIEDRPFVITVHLALDSIVRVTIARDATLWNDFDDPTIRSRLESG